MSDNEAARPQQGISPETLELLQYILAEEDGDVGAATTIPVRADPSDVPLSFAQERMWFLQQLEPDSSFYNEYLAVQLTGSLDVLALERSLNDLLQRHEVLRTIYLTFDGAPVQLVLDEQPIALPLIDLQTVAPADQAAAIQTHLRTEVGQPFDLQQGPLLRARLLRCAPQRHVLLLTLHHIVFDGWSAGVLLHDLAQLYAAARQQQPAALPALPIQYADFAAWQRQQLQDARLDTLLGYWQPQLAGAPPLCTLPSDMSRPPVQRFHGAKHKLLVSAAVADALRELSQREGTTLFMTLLAAFLVLVGRHTGQTDLVIGTRVANRTRSQLEGLIGCFVNPLVLRTDVDGDPSFATLLARVRAVCLEAYAHQELPFEKLVEVLQPQRDPSYTPLFQLMFVLQNAPMPALTAPDLSLQSLDIESETAKFDLDLTITEEDHHGLTASFEYNTELYTATTVARLAEQYATLLASIVAQPTARLSALPLCPPAQQALLDRWNATAAPYPIDTTLAQCFEAQVARTPDALAVRDAHDQLSYAQLNQRANQLAHHLQTLGVRPEVLVGVCIERSVKTTLALLAILKAGGVYVPLDPTYPAAHRDFILQETGLTVVLTEQPLLSLFNDPALTTVCLDRWDSLAQYSQDNPVAAATPDTLAFVMYTSGSTGQPKGVAVAQRQLLNRFAWMWQRYPFGAGEVVCQRTTVNFTVSMWELLGGLLQGAPTVIIPDLTVQDPAQFVAALHSYGVTRVVLVPSILRLLLNSDIDFEQQLPQLKLLTSCGEPLAQDLFERFRKRLPHVTLLNQYGASELNDVTYYEVPMSPIDLPTVPIGRPIANTRIYLLDTSLNPVPLGAPGALYVSSVSPARGYFRHPELTAERFIPDPFSHPEGARPGARLYNTGDWARYRADGTLEYLGRRDSQIKIRGIRVELAGIEAVLNQHPAVRQAVVLAQSAAPKADAWRLSAYVAPNEGEQVSVHSLRSFLKAHLPQYMVPTEFVILEHMPLLPNGKVDRAALPQTEGAQQEQTDMFVAPRDELERQIAAIWSEFLSVERIGVHDNFFDLGGHSLLLVEIVTRIQQLIGKEIEITKLLEYPTIRTLAEHLSSAADQPASFENIQQEAETQRAARRRRKQQRNEQRDDELKGSMDDQA